MSKLKRVLAAAAALILTGTAVGIALNQAGVAENMTTEEWCKAIDQVRDVQRKDRFFVAVQNGADIPKAWPEGENGRVLGDCAGGTCTIAPDAAPHCSYEYTYDCGPLVGGWRVCEVWAHPYVVRGWALAAADRDDLRWYGGLGQVVAACLEHYTGAECLALLQADDKCWLLDDGRVCRHGNLLGELDTACPYARVQARMPCTVWRGAGSERTDATRVWLDADMDEL